jgi:hypothetical protein
MPAHGLTSIEVAVRLAEDGPNLVARPRPRRLSARVGAQLADPLVSLLLVAGAVTALLGDWADTAIIVLVVVLNTAIGVAQQVRADRAIAALDSLRAPTAASRTRWCGSGGGGLRPGLRRCRTGRGRWCYPGRSDGDRRLRWSRPPTAGRRHYSAG